MLFKQEEEDTDKYRLTVSPISSYKENTVPFSSVISCIEILHIDGNL